MSPCRWLCLLCFSTLLALCLVACGSDDGGNGGQNPITVNLSGTWRGTAQSTVGALTSPVAVTLTQRGRQITGRATSTNSPCFRRATVIGSVDGFMFEARIRGEGNGRIDLAGDVTADEQGISGTYSVVRGGNCTGDSGTFQLRRQ